jgi:DNA-binding beta-propeller fold protein YncE
VRGKFAAPSALLFLTLTVVVAVVLSSCTDSRNIDRPNGVAVAPDGSLYVMDFGNQRVVQLSPEGRMIRAFGRFGANPEQIFSGWDMARDREGNLFFCNIIFYEDNVVYDSIKVFSPQGNFLREIGAHEYSQDPTLAAKTPYGLDIDSEDRIYVAYYGSDSVIVYDRDGNQVGSLYADDFEDIILDGLNDVAVDDALGFIYVTNFQQSTVEQFSRTIEPDGSIHFMHTLTIGGYGRDPGELAFPQHLTVNDSNSLVYVGDLGNRRIHVFDAQGNYVTHFAPPDLDDWQVMGLAVGPDGAIYAADALNDAIWVFEPDGRLRARIGE